MDDAMSGEKIGAKVTKKFRTIIGAKTFDMSVILGLNMGYETAKVSKSITFICQQKNPSEAAEIVNNGQKKSFVIMSGDVPAVCI